MALSKCEIDLCDECDKDLRPKDAYCVTNVTEHLHAHKECVEALEERLGVKP